MTNQIGTLQILKDREYPLDPTARGGSWVEVPPGDYPVYEENDLVHWEMTGRISRDEDGFQKIGDGLFVIGGKPQGPTVAFISERYNAEGWAAVLAWAEATEGTEQQRLRFIPS